MTPFSLQGKRILVTGASSGIGKETALECSRMGANVCITGRDAARLAETLSEMKSGENTSFAGDLSDNEAQTKLVESLPALDGVVHAAGITGLTPFRSLSEKNIREIQKINWDAPLLLTQKLLMTRKINSDASIVFISSTGTRNSVPGLAAYAGSKAALEASSRILALEGAKRKIRANCVAPGLVETPMVANLRKTLSEEQLQKELEQYPLGFGAPSDVAYACVYLLSPASRWVTGQTLTLDGGLLLR